MLFIGTSEHTIDAKLRLAIPAKYRHQWDAERDGGGWYCFPWETRELRLYTEALYKKIAQPKEDDSKLAPDPDLARLKSLIFGQTEKLEMDSAGRIQIPRLLLDIAGFEGSGSQVAVVGAGDHLEIKDRADWLATIKSNRIPDLSARVQAKGLRTF